LDPRDWDLRARFTVSGCLSRVSGCRTLLDNKLSGIYCIDGEHLNWADKATGCGHTLFFVRARPFWFLARLLLREHAPRRGRLCAVWLTRPARDGADAICIKLVRSFVVPHPSLVILCTSHRLSPSYSCTTPSHTPPHPALLSPQADSHRSRPPSRLPRPWRALPVRRRSRHAVANGRPRAILPRHGPRISPLGSAWLS